MKPAIRFKPIMIFVLLAYSFGWLAALPLWLGDGLDDPWFLLWSMLMMFTPGVAALIMVLSERGTGISVGRRLGIWPLVPFGKLAIYLALGLVFPVLLILGGLAIGAWAGVYDADLANLSGFQALLTQQLSAVGMELPIPIKAMAAIQFVNIFFGAFINMIPALGEEVGWRGWLVPRLEPLGTVGMVLVSGVIWGLWHAPLILLGYNYAGAPGWLGLLAMCGMTISFGAVLAWLRIGSNSVWPAALAHGSINAAAGLMIVFSSTAPIDTLAVAPLGWTGWILPLVLAAILFTRFARRRVSEPAVLTDQDR